MSYQYTVARFNPNATDPWHPIQTRTVAAETEDEAIDRLGDYGDGTYWEVTDTDDPAVTRLNGGR